MVWFVAVVAAVVVVGGVGVGDLYRVTVLVGVKVFVGVIV